MIIPRRTSTTISFPLKLITVSLTAGAVVAVLLIVPFAVVYTGQANQSKSSRGTEINVFGVQPNDIIHPAFDAIAKPRAVRSLLEQKISIGCKAVGG